MKRSHAALLCAAVFVLAGGLFYQSGTAPQETQAAYDSGYTAGSEQAKTDAAKEITDSYQQGYEAGQKKGLADGLLQGKAAADTSTGSNAQNTGDALPGTGTSTQAAAPKTQTVQAAAGKAPAVQAETQTTTVYITDTGSKYHRNGCGYLKKILPRHRFGQCQKPRLYALLQMQPAGLTDACTPAISLLKKQSKRHPIRVPFWCAVRNSNP